MSDLTQFPGGIGSGDLHAADELLTLVYGELRRLAAAKMAHEMPGQTLQPTALVHEVWLRLSQQTDSRWRNREHFYAVAAELMRRILVDRARRRQTQKHGGHWERVALEGLDLSAPDTDAVVLRIHDALERLAVEDAEKAEVVKLRFFVGLENAEVAAVLGVSEKTVQRHWSFAKAWLYRAMQSAE